MDIYRDFTIFPWEMSDPTGSWLQLTSAAVLQKHRVTTAGVSPGLEVQAGNGKRNPGNAWREKVEKLLAKSHSDGFGMEYFHLFPPGI